MSFCTPYDFFKGKMKPANGSSFVLGELIPSAADVKMIKSGSELYFLYCLNNYAMKMFGYPLTLDNLKVDSHLFKGTYFNYIMLRGFMPSAAVLKQFHNMTVDESFHVDIQRAIHQALFTESDCSGVEPTEIKGTDLRYDLSKSDGSYYIFCNSSRNFTVVSLLAYVMIRRVADNRPYKLIIDLGTQSIINDYFADLKVLQDYGNKMISGAMCELRYQENIRYQLDDSTRRYFQCQLGYDYRLHQFTNKEKFMFATHKFPKGSVVLLYKRQHTDNRSHTSNPIVSCVPAVVEKIEKDYILLTSYPSITTRLTQVIQTEVNMRISKLYTENDKYSFAVIKNRVPWDEIGVDKFSNNEGIFILDVFEEDGSYQWLTDGVNKSQVWLNTPETIYAVFEDHNVPYNREAFYDRFFAKKGIIPVFDQWKARAAGMHQ